MQKPGVDYSDGLMTLLTGNERSEKKILNSTPKNNYGVEDGS